MKAIETDPIQWNFTIVNVVRCIGSGFDDFFIFSLVLLQQIDSWTLVFVNNSRQSHNTLTVLHGFILCSKVLVFLSSMLHQIVRKDLKNFLWCHCCDACVLCMWRKKAGDERRKIWTLILMKLFRFPVETTAMIRRKNKERTRAPQHNFDGAMLHLHHWDEDATRTVEIF